MKHKPYSEITVEIRTQLKTVKITLNIFAVYHKLVSTSPSHLEAHPGFFRLSMKGKFDVYLS